MRARNVPGVHQGRRDAAVRRHTAEGVDRAAVVDTGFLRAGIRSHPAVAVRAIRRAPATKRCNGITAPVYVTASSISFETLRVFSPAVDDALRSMNLRVLKTPVRAPQANAFCERLIGTARRECLDYVIPLNERQLRKILAERVPHYNRGRPHACLGPGTPEPPTPTVARLAGHQIPQGHRVAAKPILAGLHHGYRLERLAA